MSRFWELEQHGDAPAFVQDDGRILSYRRAAQEADLLASHFGKDKKLVFIVCANNLESVIGYLACLRSGHVPLLLNAGPDAEAFQRIVQSYRPHFIWGPSQNAGACRYGRYALEAAAQADDLPIHQNLALLLTTSGSTGSPKLVRLSAGNVDANAHSIAQYLELTAEERPITVLPMNYSYGLSVINSHLLVGARILLTNAPVIQKPFWTFFNEQAATSLVGVPYTYAMYHRMGLFRMSLPSLRTMTQAGGKLAPDKVREFAEWARGRGIRFFVMYGQTEATARMSYLPPERVIDKNASVGIAIPGGSFSILDVDDREITRGGVAGELVYRGPNVFLGYAECRADLQKDDENHGLLKTGDIAQYDDEGYVYITGRLKRFIKLAGNRVGLDDVEAHFKAHGLEAYCGGKDDLLCVAVLRPDDTLRARQLIENGLHFHPTMFRVFLVPEVPRNDSGKIQYQRLFQEVPHD